MKEKISGKFPFLPHDDRKKIENKYHKTNEEFDGFQRMAYHGYDYDEATGLTDEEIDLALCEISKASGNKPHTAVKAQMVAYVLDHTRIDINENDYFIGLYSWGRLIDKYTVNPWYREVEKKADKRNSATKRSELAATGTAWIGLDFDHTVPDWESMTRLGFRGMLKRADDAYEKLKKATGLTEKQEIFYCAVRTEYEAILRFIARLYEYSLTKKFAKAETISASLKNLYEGAPKNTYDVLQMIYIYFMISESVEHYQVRSLGYGLDATLYPFFKRDIESNTFTKEEIARFTAYFLMQFYAMGNYWGQPFYLAGTNVDGSTKVNELSYLILDVYNSLGIYNPKIQIKISKYTLRDFVNKALDMIKSGSTSIVFCNEDIITKSLMRNGADYESAVDSVIKDCYEYTTKADCIGISFNTFNALKPVSLVFNNGADKRTGIEIGIKTGDVTKFTSFKEFYAAYLAQFRHILETGTKQIDELEQYISEVNPMILYSATVPKCVKTLTDANDSGIKNVTDVLLNGLASAADALMAVYELVFETKQTTLDELKKALDNNWEGYENLRLKALSCKHKYGVGDKTADYYANSVHQFFSSHFAGKRNCHGGNYEYELHSARAFIEMGKLTEATPDGRRAGDETSKNASPTPGADKNGVTALINSVTEMDLSLADSGACLDIMLHPTAVCGDGGADILYGVLNTYMSKGGASVHFNIFNSDVLRDAQKHPEKYKNLQVRVCGWNVLWNNMSKAEQEAYIKRAENIQ